MAITVKNIAIKGSVLIGPPVSTFLPGDFDFTDGTVSYTSNTVTFTKNGKLYISSSGDPSGVGGECYLNGVAQNFYTTEAYATQYEQSGTRVSIFNPSTGFIYYGTFGVIPVSVGDQMYFTFSVYESNPASGTNLMSIRINSFSGILISQTTITKSSGCYLTTAAVYYKGLDDNGPELTAMRSLRENYRGDSYYESLIAEYYQNSPLILEGINLSQNPAEEYEFIYNSVLIVKSFVDNNQWEEAGNEYMNTYLTLKNKYII